MPNNEETGRRRKVIGETPRDALTTPSPPTTPTPLETSSSSSSPPPPASPEAVIKHPLNSKWTIWYYINDKHLKWEENQVLISSFDTVEDFWALFNHIESASRLKIGCDYSIFKEGIRPMWEDPANIHGGRWSITLQKQQRATELDSLWLEMVMMMLGESADEDMNKDVCGAVVSVRPRGDRLALWTADSKSSDLVLGIGRCLKSSLSLNPNHTIEYNLHSDTSNKRSSTVRALHSI